MIARVNWLEESGCKVEAAGNGPLIGELNCNEGVQVNTN